MSYSHVTTFERARIETLNALNYSTRAIAEEIGRCHTTVSRELKRHTKPHEEYQSERAQASYEERRTVAVMRNGLKNLPSRLNRS